MQTISKTSAFSQYPVVCVKRFFLSVVLLSWLSSCHQATPGAAKTDSARLPATDSLPAWSLTGFSKLDSANPILRPGKGVFSDPVTRRQVAWEARNVFNPAIVVRNDTVFMLYRAQDSAGTSRVGLATSTDGIHFTRNPAPVLFPQADEFKKYEWPGGCEDPRVVQDSAGIFYMTYTAFDGKNARLLIASSTDLLHWKKRGAVFADAYKGKYRDEWSKSGAIVSRYNHGKIIAEKINGKYWMYWGDQFIWTAVSDDLLHWTPVEKQPGDTSTVPLRGIAVNMPALKIAVATREKHFDSDLVESGPPAMITDNGILLLYNSRNIPDIGDPNLPLGTYAAGQVLFDAHDPTKTISRLDHYFISPSQPYELTGEVNNVCFIEGLAQFRQQYFLYYGTADSKIAVAIRH